MILLFTYLLMVIKEEKNLAFRMHVNGLIKEILLSITVLAK